MKESLWDFFLNKLLPRYEQRIKNMKFTEDESEEIKLALRQFGNDVISFLTVDYDFMEQLATETFPCESDKITKLLSLIMEGIFTGLEYPLPGLASHSFKLSLVKKNLNHIYDYSKFLIMTSFLDEKRGISHFEMENCLKQSREYVEELLRTEIKEIQDQYPLKNKDTQRYKVSKVLDKDSSNSDSFNYQTCQMALVDNLYKPTSKKYVEQYAKLQKEYKSIQDYLKSFWLKGIHHHAIYHIAKTNNCEMELIQELCNYTNTLRIALFLGVIFIIILVSTLFTNLPQEDISFMVYETESTLNAFKAKRLLQNYGFNVSQQIGSSMGWQIMLHEKQPTPKEIDTIDRLIQSGHLDHASYNTNDLFATINLFNQNTHSIKDVSKESVSEAITSILENTPFILHANLLIAYDNKPNSKHSHPKVLAQLILPKDYQLKKIEIIYIQTILKGAIPNLKDSDITLSDIEGRIYP